LVQLLCHHLGAHGARILRSKALNMSFAQESGIFEPPLETHFRRTDGPKRHGGLTPAAPMCVNDRMEPGGTGAMDQSELRQTLRVLQFSARLSQPSAEKLAALMTACEFPAGAVLFEEGDDNPWLYLITEGEIALDMCVPARGCTRIMTLGRGDLLAWSALLGDGRMTASAVALSPAKLLAASAAEVSALCTADAAFGCEVMRGVALALSKRLVATRLQLLDLFSTA
jgi:CRP-like cAMP-binding protein